MKSEKVPMTTLSIEERKTSFKEVFSGYTEAEAVLEASRCLNCKTPPCEAACPIRNAIPDFIAEIKNGNFDAAYELISNKSSLPSVCSRVCPHERQCEGSCTMGVKNEPVNIGALERFVADRYLFGDTVSAQTVTKSEKRVAIIGSGPSGLACADELIKLGVSVTVYEQSTVIGGILAYGIPEFRLPAKIVSAYVNALRNKGVKFVTGVKIGQNVTLIDLKNEGYAAFFVGIGSGISKNLGIEGEDLRGVLSAEEFLYAVKTGAFGVRGINFADMKNKRVAVVGGGNVAMDAARTAVRFGADATVVYRRSREELPACKEEVNEAEAEGVKFNLLVNPVRVIEASDTQNGAASRVCAIECTQNVLGAPDSSGRRRPVEVEGSNFITAADFIITAIGSGFDCAAVNSIDGLKTGAKGNILVDDGGSSSVDGVFAGGDAVTGPLTVVEAMKSGKIAANSILKYLNGKI